MQRERDELVKFVFPKLRKLCERRGVGWGYVDLRWGITEEQTAEGSVLPICMDEIKRCRPYFIGVLGERYGWVPDDIPRGLAEREPWLAAYSGRSVTELEMLHGVLNDPGMAEHAFFYFRDPGYLKKLPPEQRASFGENASEEEINRLGEAEARRRAEARKRKLDGLKERIRRSGFPVLENYEDPGTFGDAVLRDLTSVIDRLYPEGSLPDPLDREAKEHETYARSRAQVYIGRKAYTDRLDAHARSGDRPLVLLGESGSGKSALLANWAIRYRAEHPDDPVIMHFIGAAPGSTDWAAMLRRVMGELKRRFGIRDEIPDKPDALRLAFANWLSMAASHGRVILILDALNQLDDRDGAQELAWLPPHIPENIRIYLSTLPGRPLDELASRGWSSLTVEPLLPGERKKLIADYLALSARALGAKHTDLVAGAPQCGNPLFLRVLLDELQQFGEHERLGERIAYYLGARDIPALYGLVLGRCEDDYERNRPGLVRCAMTLLWAARRGLSETELLEMLGEDGGPLPGAYWSPLFLALEQSLLSRGGLIGFFHDYLRQAVESRYLAGETAKKEAHLRIAEYYAKQEGVSARKADELPWQLARAKDWERLCALLGDTVFFEAVWELDGFDAKAYWAQLEKESPCRMTDAYAKALDEPGLFPDHVWTIATLFGDTGHNAEALRLRSHITERARKAGDLRKLQMALGNQGVSLIDLGSLDEAMKLFKEEERICVELGDMNVLKNSLGNQANILRTRGDMEGAMALQKRKERICLELDDQESLAGAYNDEAIILDDQGDFRGALALYQKGEQIYRRLGNRSELATVMMNQSSSLYALGDLAGAMALLKKCEAICRELGDMQGLVDALGNQANNLFARGDNGGAMALYAEAADICRRIGNRMLLQRTLGNQANILHAGGDLEDAMELLEEKERICVELGYKAGLAVAYGNKALILKDWGRFDEATDLYLKEEKICRELKDRVGLQRSLGNRANILRALRRFGEAMSLLTEQEGICREIAYQQGLAICLINQAAILASNLGRAKEALPRADEAYRIAAAGGYEELAERINSARAFIGARLR
jgi:tetratricopeptide (TPR) repeat protein